MHMSKARWVKIAAGIAVVALCVWVWVRVPKSVEYETIEIPLPEGYSSFDDLWINDRGVVAGTLNEGKGDHLFLWDRDNGLTDIGNPGSLSGRTDIRVEDINNQGQLIGYYGLSPTNSNNQPGDSIPGGPFFYDPKTGFREIGTMKGFQHFNVCAINARGQVVGRCFRINPDGKAEWRIFLWNRESGFRDLELVGFPQDINQAGQILGGYPDREAIFVWSPDGNTDTLDPSPYGLIVFGCLDDSGQIVGLVENEKNHEKLRVIRWNRKQGYHSAVRIGKQDTGGYATLGLNERRILFYEESKPFDWFGLAERFDSKAQIRLYTVGEGVTNPKGIPKVENPEFKSWGINRDGWIVLGLDGRAYVMIPKGKAERKKD